MCVGVASGANGRYTSNATRPTPFDTACTAHHASSAVHCLGSSSAAGPPLAPSSAPPLARFRTALGVFGMGFAGSAPAASHARDAFRVVTVMAAVLSFSRHLVWLRGCCPQAGSERCSSRGAGRPCNDMKSAKLSSESFKLFYLFRNPGEFFFITALFVLVLVARDVCHAALQGLPTLVRGLNRVC
jgi:hypothetical protein